MEISGVASSIESRIQSVAGKSFGKEDFLKLLTKQLSYQDPLNPMDSTAFTSQLTQFSSLEQLSNMSGTLNDILAFQHSMQNASISNLIGRTVEIAGNTVYLNNTAEINYELPQDASVKISIYDAAGKPVAAIPAGQQSMGDNTFVWDGKDSLGNQMPVGTYTYEIEAKDASGKSVTAVTNASGIVTGVSFKDGNTLLVLNGGRNIYLSDILTIQ